MSFQDSVIKEIADMVKTKEALYKITYLYPHIDSSGIVIEKAIVILDYSTFEHNSNEVITETLKHHWESILKGGHIDAYWFGDICCDYSYKLNDLERPIIMVYVTNVELLN